MSMNINIRELIEDKKIKNLLIALAVVGAIETASFASIQLPLILELAIFAGVVYFWGRGVIMEGLESLWKMRFSDINLLMTIAIVGAVFLQKFEEASIIIVLFGLGEALEEYGVKRSRAALRRLVGNFPKTVEIKGGKEMVGIGQVKIGQVMIIRPGDKIGLDGKVVYGDSLVDESMITGEPLPKSKAVGDKVYAGSINDSGYLEVEILKESKDSTLNKIIQLTGESLKRKAESQKFIEKFARYYTPAMMLLSISIFAVPVLLFGGSVQFWLVQALTILLISCPCALVISTPITIFSAVGNASQKGALIKGGKVIENLSQIREIGFDKTKTLTEGTPEVTDIIPFNGFTREEILSCSAGLAGFSEHPLSKGIVEKAKELGMDIHKFSNFTSVQGKGVVGNCLVCTDIKHCLGKLNIIDGQSGNNEETMRMLSREAEGMEKDGKTVVYLGDEKMGKGLIALSDRVKKESKHAVAELQRLGVQCFMVTGDNEGAARFVASQVDIGEIYAGALPEDKARIVAEKTEKDIKVAMVGDGVNDAPSLAGASVGIAMGSLGSDIAIETADIALMNDDLELIPYLIGLSKKSVAKIRFNTFFALGTKLLFLVLAILGMSSLSLAIFADVGVTLIVVLNGLSLYGFKTK